MLPLLYKITYLVTFFGAFAIGAFVLIRGWGKKFNIVWALLHLNVIVWSLGRYMMLLATDAETALFWSRISTFGSFFIYPFFLHALLILIDKENRKIIYFFYGIAACLTFFNLLDMTTATNFVVKGVRPKLSFPFYDEPNTLWALHLFSTALCPLIAVFELSKSYRTASTVMRNRIKFILFATIVGIIGGSTNVPLVYNIQVEPIGAPLVPVYLIFISYAIYKYRLMEINYFIYRGLSYAFLSALFIIPSIILYSFFLQSRFGDDYLASLVLLGAILSTGILILPKFKAWTETTISKTFMKNWMLYEEISREFVNLITSTIDIGKLASRIVRLIGSKLNLTNVSLYLLDEDGRRYTLFEQYGGGTPPESLEADSDFNVHLKATGDVIVREEMERRDEGDEVKHFVETQDLIGAEMSVPFLSKSNLIAVLNLGPKKNGKFYSLEEIGLLRNIGGEGAVALENALAFKEIEDLNVNLERKVQERTEELEKALKDLKEMQVHLVHSEKMASLGVITAGMAHEAYNPLTACISSTSALQHQLDRIKTGTAKFEDLEDKCVRATVRIQNGLKRVENIITNLKRFSRKDVEGIKSNDINEGIEATIDLVKDQVGGDVTIHKDLICKEPVECDLGQMNQVFLNMIQNAIQALGGHGDIWISTKVENNHIDISFRDNASGIPKDVLSHIFEPFYTTKDVGKGTGLGLSICQRIISDHNGEIKVTSRVGDGSEFCISIPLSQNPHNS
ncbi:ATP-binding protein [Thermodesulfobacteriota bacterium]